MIGTTQLVCLAFGLGHYRRRMVPADIVETTKDSITASDDRNWFAAYVICQVLTWLTKLIGARRKLPGTREHGSELAFVQIFVCVPGRGNSRGFIQWRFRIVATDDFFENTVHRLGDCVNRSLIHRLHRFRRLKTNTSKPVAGPLIHGHRYL